MENSTAQPSLVSAEEVRYIRFGKRGDIWERLSLERGEMHFGYGGLSHSTALACDLEEIVREGVRQGRNPRDAVQDGRQVHDFYRLGSDCLWITFARGHLWWAFADPEVMWLGGNPAEHGERVRKTIGGWRNTDLRGVPLRIDSLSTRLTQVANYRRTICTVGEKDYLLRRINGAAEPLVEKGNEARRAMLHVIEEAIATLHWEDFETLVDVIFARSGWHRKSALGGKLPVVDLVLEQPTTGELAAVQVKSQADQTKLRTFIERADTIGTFDRLFFACHTPSGHLDAPEARPDVQVWSSKKLSELTLRTGLTEWVLEKVG